ncbi:hypothetical protein [Actinoplanes awajinensis]|uniref:Uncharacterized protein n=1 Tax=Actinoplanes awajinensis subsp. mycoplanecinus TaxID=135947 RepID=A0A101JKL6_9ACTN|nr:hypothetical protein [Actinoplanes awajinensis]KUL28473.1 hypothetical protein ADL15_32170 [Actinoplanes awajinensis subsp. mycoplanecinus]
MSGRIYGRPVTVAGGADTPPSLRQELQDTPGFSGAALLLAVGGSLVGTILTTAMGSGPWGSLAGAAVGPVVSTVFSTKLTGEHGRVRAAAILILSVAALAITLTGVKVTEGAAGQPVIPGAEDRSGTFALSESDESNQRNGTSGENVPAGGVEPTVTPTVLPSATPSPEPSPSPSEKTDTCLTGYVWREAVPGDQVCVTPETRDQAAVDNAAAGDRRDPAGGAYGPDTCLTGFVWREAVADDHVCVLPETREQARADNDAAAERRVT